MAVNILGNLAMRFGGTLSDYEKYKVGNVDIQEIYVDGHSDYQRLVVFCSPLAPSIYFILSMDVLASVACLGEVFAVLYPNALHVWNVRSGEYHEFHLRSVWNELKQFGRFLVLVDIFEIHFLNIATQELTTKDLGTNIVDVLFGDWSLTVLLDDMPATVINLSEL